MVNFADFNEVYDAKPPTSRKFHANPQPASCSYAPVAKAGEGPLRKHLPPPTQPQVRDFRNCSREEQGF